MDKSPPGRVFCVPCAGKAEKDETKLRAKKLLLILILTVVLIVALVLYCTGRPGSGGNSHAAESALVLSEVMASNKGSVPDENGDYPDWVELKNTGSTTLDIAGFGLTDDFTAGVKYVFPSGTKVEPGGYVVVWCSGESTGGLTAPFRLSASDSLVLFDVTGNTLDTLVLRAVASGNTLAKDASGAWVEMRPSPGYDNTEAGVAAFEASLQGDEDIGVVINEFMASNATTIADAYGVYSDWIELYNKNDYEVDLSGCGLSDTISQPKKYILPEGTVIPANGYLVIFCSGNEGFTESGELHAPFGLRAYQEDVVLSGKRGTILDSFSYGTQETDCSMARVPDGTGEFAETAHPTPGYANDDAGYQAFAASVIRAKSDVYISELLGKNISAKAAPDGEYYDCIELHNRGAEVVSLSGCALSDNPKNPAKWVFPEGTELAPGEYLVVYASGLNAKAAKSDLHTNFNLSAAGASVYLFGADGLLMDKLQTGAFLNNMSYGIDAEGNYACFQTATLGAANGMGQKGVTAKVQFLTTPGIYDGEIEIALSAPAGETIHYTLDCTTPTANSPVYDGPIKAAKNTVVRAVSVREGYVTNDTVSGTFLFRSDDVNHSLPVVTLVTDPDNLWSNEKGIYAFGENYDPTLGYGDAITTANFWKSKTAPDQWERLGCFGVFDETGREVFSQNIGMRIAGSFGRGRAQKGFNLIARDAYGDNRMAYPFFENLDFTEYKAIVLRAGAQDQNNGKFRDELATGLLVGSDVNFLYQAYKPCVLYLNGEYWGVYFMKEKRNRFFVAQHEGTEDNVNVDIIRSATSAYNGSAKEWAEFMTWLHGTGDDLSSASNYAYADARVDLDSFMDYMICEIYSANSDVWNIQYYKVKDGKWKWIYYDFCWSFGASENRTNHQTLSIRRLSSKPCSDLFNALLKNSDWRDRFCRRFAELLNTIYAPETVLAKIDELYAQVEPEIAREREKFNGETFMGVTQHSEVRGTYEGFLRQVEIMRNFASGRPDSIKQQIQKEFGLSDSYMQEVFG